MKRSQINRLIEETMAWLEQRQVVLPPFASTAGGIRLLDLAWQGGNAVFAPFSPCKF